MRQREKTTRVVGAHRSRRRPYSTSAVAGDVELYHVGLAPDPHLPLDVQMAGRSVWGEGDSVRDHVSTGESLELVVRGEGVLLCNGREYTLRRGDVFFLHRGVRHTYHARPGVLWHKVFVILWPDTAKALLQQLGLQDVVCIHIPHTKFAAVHKLFTSMLQLAHTKPPLFRDHLSERAYELLVELAHIHQAEAAKQTRPTPLQRALAHVEERGCGDVSVHSMAAAAGCSPRHLSRLFSRAYHLTAHAWLVRFRLQHACALLQRTDLRIGDIAEAVGYLDPLHFAKVFRRVIGCSPRAYRLRTRPESRAPHP